MTLMVSPVSITAWQTCCPLTMMSSVLRVTTATPSSHKPSRIWCAYDLTLRHVEPPVSALDSSRCFAAVVIGPRCALVGVCPTLPIVESLSGPPCSCSGSTLTGMPAAKKPATMKVKSSGGVRHVKTVSGGYVLLGPDPVELSVADAEALVARGKAVPA